MCAISKLGMPCQALRPQECTRVEFLQLLGNSFGRKSWVVVGTEALPQSNLRQKQQGTALEKGGNSHPGKAGGKNGPQVSQVECLRFSSQGYPSASSREQTLQPPEHLSPTLAAKGA